jgi:hypothetical protein
MGFWDSLKNIGKKVLQIGAPIAGGVAGSFIGNPWLGASLGGAIAKLAADKVTGSSNSALGSAIKGAAGGALGHYAANAGGGGFGGLWDTVKNPSNLWQNGGGTAIKQQAMGGASAPASNAHLQGPEMLDFATKGGQFVGSAAPAAATTVAPVATGVGQGGWIKNLVSGMEPWQKQALLMQGISSGFGALGAYGQGQRMDDMWAEELRKTRRREEEIDRTRDYRREIMNRLENFQYPSTGV